MVQFKNAVYVRLKFSRYHWHRLLPMNDEPLSMEPRAFRVTARIKRMCTKSITKVQLIEMTCQSRLKVLTAYISIILSMSHDSRHGAETVSFRESTLSHKAQ